MSLEIPQDFPEGPFRVDIYRKHSQGRPGSLEREYRTFYDLWASIYYKDSYRVVRGRRGGWELVKEPDAAYVGRISFLR